MKQQKILRFVTTAVGIGTAMSVALKDTAVGMAIGVAIGFAFTFYNPSCQTDSEEK